MLVISLKMSTLLRKIKTIITGSRRAGYAHILHFTMRTFNKNVRYFCRQLRNERNNTFQNQELFSFWQIILILNLSSVRFFLSSYIIRFSWTRDKIFKKIPPFQQFTNLTKVWTWWRILYSIFCHPVGVKHHCIGVCINK